MSIGPQIDVVGDRLIARTSRTARVLSLYSFDRRVTLDRQRGLVTSATTRLWLWKRERRVPFDQVERIVLRAQPLEGLGFWTFLSLGVAPAFDGALFLISLGLRNRGDELFLFTVWEGQGGGDPIAGMASGGSGEPSLGDERAGDVIARLREFLPVPVASH